MSLPILTPDSTTSKVILPMTGTATHVHTSSNPLPFGIYMGMPGEYQAFASGAADQVSYVYKKLGGDVLDVELTQYNVYAAYEESVLEYSYLINIHQAKNSLGDLLGHTTASFDQDGQITGSSPTSKPLSGSYVESKFPRFTFSYIKRAASGVSTEASLNADINIYSASFSPTADQQSYDLQQVVSGNIASGTLVLDSGDVFNINDEANINKKLTIRKVFYKTPRAMWRFFGYYGGLNVIGNLSNYGQYSDDSQFEVVPTWQNKLQAIMYEDSIFTRISHYSYELHNNKLRLYPTPQASSMPDKFWFRFSIEKDPWTEYSDKSDGAAGVNNMSNLPYANIRYTSINSIGKQWIRRFALALCKEMLGQIRGKLGNNIPIPGGNITLNATDLLGQAKAEQDSLREELKTILDELTYAKLAAKDGEIIESVAKAQAGVPVPVFVG
jgi:hypothetical protein